MCRAMCYSFFFSSRRRHTSCYRDWSSDVCSSDLATVTRQLVRGGASHFIESGRDAARQQSGRRLRIVCWQSGRRAHLNNATAAAFDKLSPGKQPETHCRSSSNAECASMVCERDCLARRFRQVSASARAAKACGCASAAGGEGGRPGRGSEQKLARGDALLRSSEHEL